jgi:hypothetical protein
VQRADAVQPRGERVADVVLERRGGLDVHHHEHAARDERRADAAQHPRRVDLVVDRVERRDGLERRVGRQRGDIDDLERRVREPPGGGLLPGSGDRVVGDVIADERRPGETRAP